MNKASEFEPAHVDLARFFKALGHPARVEILQVLTRQGRCLCGEIVDELPLAQATVSQHLKALKSVGLIRGEVEGPAICYCIDNDALAQMREAVDRYFDSITQDCC